jgi:DNA primase
MDFKDQVKSQVDIVKAIGEYVRLKRLGATGRYVGLCPFHQEKTPSFSVNQTRQFYKCFGCGKGGDVFRFFEEIEGITFFEALKQVAERNGIAMPKRTEHSDAESKLRGALLEIHEIAASLFQSALRGPQGAEARAYIERRGMSAEMIEVFGLGYTEPGGQALVRRLQQEKFTPEQLDASALVRRRDDGSLYDSFRGRLMFPIHNESGKVIAFGGRAMREEDQPKYLNSSETPIYRKSSVLYNLHRARNEMRRLDRAVLVEGYMDVIGVYAAGVKDVVASCGTSLTAGQVRRIHAHADHVVVNFDPDTAGERAAESAIQLFLDEGVHVRVLTLDGGLDPDEYAKQNGADAYRRKLDDSPGYFHWLADRARTKFDMRSSDGRMDAFKFLLESVKKVGDKLERAAIASDLAGYLGVEPGLVLDQFKRAAAERRAPTAVAVESGPAIPALERMLVHALMSSEEARSEMLPRLAEAATAGFATHEIVAALRNLHTAGSPVTFSAVEGRLSPPAGDLLHQIVAADETIDELQALEQARACLRKLESDFRKRRIDDLRAQGKAAEREGRMDEALGIIAEIERLRKELNGAGV